MGDFDFVFTLNNRDVVHQTRLTLAEISWRAMGGCETLRLDASGAEASLWQWAARLMAGVEVYAPDATLIWSGVLWGVTLTTPWGTFDYSLDDVANRVRAMYSDETQDEQANDVRISSVAYDADDEYVEIENIGSIAVDMNDWKLGDRDRHTFIFPSFTLAAGATVRVWTGTGTDDATNLYWGLASSVWNDLGDTATLKDDTGQTISTFIWGSRGGTSDATAWADDANSQARYGVIERILTNAIGEDQAVAMRDRELALYAWPSPVQSPDQRAAKMTARLTAMGHYARLNHLIYNDATRGALDTAAIARLIRARFSWANTSEALIQDTGVLATRKMEDNNTAQYELARLAKAGSSDGRRVLCGVDERKRLYFYAAPEQSDVSYFWKGGAIHDSALRRAHNWQVRPGHWAEQIDIVAPTLPGVSEPGRFFIERVTLTTAGVRVEPVDAKTIEAMVGEL